MKRLLGVVAILVLVALFARTAMASTYVHATKTAIVTVQSGDTLWSIAERVDKHRDPRQTVFDIMQANGLRDAVIQPGQVLVLPPR